jgi:amino acid transporter
LGSSAPRTDTGPARRLRPWAATAMVISQVVGVGIFLTPAAMMRTLGSATAALAVWAVIGTLSIAGALVYAELTTRFPKAGGGYVFLREAFGPRSAFVFGWMALLVTDPGITAALGIGLAQYLLAATAGSQALAPYVAVAAIWAFGLLTLAGIGVSAAVLRWTAVAKLVIVAVLVGAGALRASSGSSIAGTAVATGAIGVEAWAGAVIAAFFAFGGWWELGRMSEEVESPSRTMPRALVGGLAIVTGIYALISLAYVLAVSGQRVEGTDEAFVSIVGNALFGPAAARLLRRAAWSLARRHHHPGLAGVTADCRRQLRRHPRLLRPDDGVLPRVVGRRRPPDSAARRRWPGLQGATASSADRALPDADRRRARAVHRRAAGAGAAWCRGRGTRHPRVVPRRA